ncbi:MAG: glycerol-3-phosphate acyltransferase, partial [Actinobacteria bacterium]
MVIAAFVVAGYLCGSLTWGYWLVRIFRGEDIRT